MTLRHFGGIFLIDCDISATVQVGMLLILYQQVRVDGTYPYTNNCNHNVIVCWRSMGLSDIAWVDCRSDSQAKTKTKQSMVLKLAVQCYGI